NFDINVQGLPTVRNLPLKIGWSGANLSVTLSNQLYADNRMCVSTNLLNWSPIALGLETALPVPTVLPVAPTLPSRYFLHSRVLYPPTLYTPRSVARRVISLSFSSGPIAGTTLTLSLDAGGGIGGYAWSGGLSGIAFYTWIQDP